MVNGAPVVASCSCYCCVTNQCMHHTACLQKGGGGAPPRVSLAPSGEQEGCNGPRLACTPSGAPQRHAMETMCGWALRTAAPGMQPTNRRPIAGAQNAHLRACLHTAAEPNASSHHTHCARTPRDTHTPGGRSRGGHAHVSGGVSDTPAPAIRLSSKHKTHRRNIHTGRQLLAVRLQGQPCCQAQHGAQLVREAGTQYCAAHA
jgi:hypothetical protein